MYVEHVNIKELCSKQVLIGATYFKIEFLKLDGFNVMTSLKVVELHSGATRGQNIKSFAYTFKGLFVLCAHYQKMGT